ncbi:MAG TPA: hypothetical protein VNR70_10765 [Steroidobacteraceae bacterium]|nr:hypothetical protein [Steroidobacteraceae bacterium]
MRILQALLCLALVGNAVGKPSTTIYAQELVNRVIANHPEVVVVAMHVSPPKGGENVIIASNIGRIGKRADADDLKVIQTGAPNLAVNKAGDRFEAELVLKDANSRSIGALGVVFPYMKGQDTAPLQAGAKTVRIELSRRITNADNLLQPYPFDGDSDISPDGHSSSSIRNAN